MRYILVDRVADWKPWEHITGVKNVAMSEDFLEFHFPKNPIMPGIMLLEALVQLAGWLEAVSTDFEKWFLLSKVLKCNFYGFVLPGDQVNLKITATPGPSEDLKTYSGVGEVNGKRKIKAEFRGNPIALDKIEDIEEQKRFFQILTRKLKF